MDFLPEFMDPILSNLESLLPGPVYSTLIAAVSYSLAICTALISILPSAWTAESLIPPTIIILAAYLAFSSIYRTIRFSIWLVKWGTILVALMAGLGWFMSGNVGGLLALGVGGGAGRAGKSSSSRPKMWESWDRHDQYRQQKQGRTQSRNGAEEVQKFVQELAGAAGRVYAQSGDWWETTKGVVEEIEKHARAGWEEATSGSRRQSKSKSGKSAGTR